jgi:hypothetical protein
VNTTFNMSQKLDAVQPLSLRYSNSHKGWTDESDPVNESAVSGAQCLKYAAPRVHGRAGHLGRQPPCDRASGFGYCVP